MSRAVCRDDPTRCASLTTGGAGRILATLFVSLLLTPQLCAQSIFTYAGSSSEDGLPALSTRLKSPRAGVLDAEGNLYFLDGGSAFDFNARVRRIDAVTTIVTTVAGTGIVGYGGDNGPAIDAQISANDIAMDAAGNLYLADSGNYRIRKVNLTTGVITTFAGQGTYGFSGDGGPAINARLQFPASVEFDRSGNLFAVDSRRVRRITPQGIITTIAGNGTNGYSGDNGPASAAALNLGSRPGALAFDATGNLYIADDLNNRVRKVDASGIITTFAGNGTPAANGDGGPATSAGLAAPFALAIGKGSLFIFCGVYPRKIDLATNVISQFDYRGSASGSIFFDSAEKYLYQVNRGEHRISRLDVATSNTPVTIAGDNPVRDGVVATSADLYSPHDVTFDPAGNLYIAENTRIRRVDAVTHIITTLASLSTSTFAGLAADSDQNVYVADRGRHRVLRFDRAGAMLTIVGTGTAGYNGDDIPAVNAQLNTPFDIALDQTGNLLIADTNNNRVRKVGLKTGLITTIAGNGQMGATGDGGDARSATLNNPSDLAVDRLGNLFINTGGIRKVNPSGIISTVTGGFFGLIGLALDPNGDLYVSAQESAVLRVRSADGTSTLYAGGPFGFSGDNGPANKAALAFNDGLATDVLGNLAIADSFNDRVRYVPACRSVGATVLQQPPDQATNTAAAPSLKWSAADASFRYDVLLAATNPPATVVAANLTSTRYVPSNLASGTTYYWRVIAHGDPYCAAQTTTSSSIRSFTTSTACTAPGPFSLTAPADNASGIGAAAALTWSASPGAGSYDVLLGTSNPPPFVAATNATSFNATGLSPGSTYSWSVVARAACSREKTTTTLVRTFRTSGGCPTPGAFTLMSPLNGATAVASTTTLEWSASTNGTSYDLYLGTASDPPIYLLDVASTKITVSGLAPGQRYFWRVIAKIGCDASRRVSTPVSSFTVRSGCAAPRSTSFTFTPPGAVGIGQTYVLSWKESDDLDAEGYYLVERSTNVSFDSIADSQKTTDSSASFVAPTAGTWYHRVRPVNPCASGAASTARAVTVLAASPNVIFTVQPEAVITALGDKLEAKRGRFVLENIATETISVIIGRQEIDSVPFFTIADPGGGESAILTLEPRKPKELQLRFSGPPNDVAASYQGVIFLASLGKGLAITPYAFVNLRVGGGDAAGPEFRSGTSTTEHAFFPGFAGDDTTRPPITVDIRNPGSTPMELGAEIGPEVWLVPETGWNASAIPAGATRTVKLFTRRYRAPNGSALPRYTYFTVRTKTGRSARLLVQDNDLARTAAGRNAALDPLTKSVIVPDASSVDAQTHTVLRLSNVGTGDVSATLYFTPEGADGFDASRVKRATILVPASDVVTLTDPLTQLWGLARPVKGQIEVQADPEKLGQLGVRAVIVRTASGGSGFSYGIPTVSRGDGVFTGASHVLPGVSSNSKTHPSLTLAETSGVDAVTVKLTLFDSSGVSKGSRDVVLARYGMTELDEITTLLGGGSAIEGARIAIEVTAGGGSATAVLKLLDRANGGGTTALSQPDPGLSGTQSGIQSHASPPQTYLLPAVINGPVATGSSTILHTSLGLLAMREAASFTLTYRDGGTPRTATIPVAAGRVVEVSNVLESQLGLPSGTKSTGTLLVETTRNGLVYGRVTSTAPGVSLASVSQELTVIGSRSELVTSIDSQRPLYLDGIEQSIDPTRGSIWSLLLNELSGNSGVVIVRLYEAGNRSTPIAEKQFVLAAFQSLTMENLFAALGLDSADRKKDRANVLVSVTHLSGNAAVAAIARSMDNVTLDVRGFVLAPAGTAPVAIQKVSVIVPPAIPVKRHSVRH